ncbi:Reverse transcriptase (RNA-dependent DNA polymerase) [Popillia japonica]|uniref:Reverse transcriptase (RNA-dependent DNA polymerase) n=1 Tax=Popillia japonica TaxID=7064 RepID=A0AAW1L5F7_POPJA
MEGVGEADKQALIGILRANSSSFSKGGGCWRSGSSSFSKGDLDLGLIHLGEMKITLETNKPVNYRPYRLAASEREVVRGRIERLLASGVIRESISEYGSPIILVPKKNGEARLCVDYRALNRITGVDYRALNRITVKDRYPLPLIDDQLNKLAGKVYYTTLDLAQGYHQVPMHPESVQSYWFQRKMARRDCA